jgi:NTP pyrophosphatase (non-canonical NTP hydrolase)
VFGLAHVGVRAWLGQQTQWERDGGLLVSLNELRGRVHALARAKGWYDDVESPPNPRTIAAWLCNIHGEISEALEDVRGGRMALMFRDVETGEVLTREQRDEALERDEEPLSRFKPIGFPSELADALIRILDTCGALGIDIEETVRVKHEFNETRPRRHGGKTL